MISDTLGIRMGDNPTFNNQQAVDGNFSTRVFRHNLIFSTVLRSRLRDLQERHTSIVEGLGASIRSEFTAVTVPCDTRSGGTNHITLQENQVPETVDIALGATQELGGHLPIPTALCNQTMHGDVYSQKIKWHHIYKVLPSQDISWREGYMFHTLTATPDKIKSGINPIILTPALVLFVQDLSLTWPVILWKHRTTPRDG